MEYLNDDKIGFGYLLCLYQRVWTLWHLWDRGVIEKVYLKNGGFWRIKMKIDEKGGNTRIKMKIDAKGGNTIKSTHKNSKVSWKLPREIVIRGLEFSNFKKSIDYHRIFFVWGTFYKHKYLCSVEIKIMIQVFRRWLYTCI